MPLHVTNALTTLYGDLAASGCTRHHEPSGQSTLGVRRWNDQDFGWKFGSVLTPQHKSDSDGSVVAQCLFQVSHAVAAGRPGADDIRRTAEQLQLTVAGQPSERGVARYNMLRGRIGVRPGDHHGVLHRWVRLV